MATPERMSAVELRSALGLATLFGLRMLGMFIILPVFALYAHTLEGGSDLTLVGIALGAYGLAQALLQIPFGRWSDRVGRKPVLYFGLALFAAGSFLAAVATDIRVVIAGRILQGGGAISAVAIAMAADLTREQHRTKVMAIIGSTIGFAFAVSVVAGPWLNAWIGVPGIFVLTGVLALAAMAIVAGLPSPVAPVGSQPPVSLSVVLRVPELARLDLGIFVLHAVLMAMFVMVPLALVQAGLAADRHWQVYAVVMAGSALLMLPAVLRGDRRGGGRGVFIGAIALVAVSQAMLFAAGGSVVSLVAALLVFFTGFNILEAALPARVSRAAPAAARGSAIGVFSSVQFVGAFVGAALGGFLLQRFGAGGVLVATLSLTLLWLLAATQGAQSDRVGTRVYAVPPMDSVRAMGLTERLGALPGVRAARVQWVERTAYLEVELARFDERAALDLIAGET